MPSFLLLLRVNGVIYSKYALIRCFFFDSQSGRVYFDVKFEAIVVRLRTEVLFPSRNASGKGVGKHKGHLIHFIAASQEHHSVHTS